MQYYQFGIILKNNHLWYCLSHIKKIIISIISKIPLAIWKICTSLNFGPITSIFDKVGIGNTFWAKVWINSYEFKFPVFEEKKVLLCDYSLYNLCGIIRGLAFECQIFDVSNLMLMWDWHLWYLNFFGMFVVWKALQNEGILMCISIIVKHIQFHLSLKNLYVPVLHFFNIFS